jgi:hypothetical protein
MRVRGGGGGWDKALKGLAFSCYCRSAFFFTVVHEKSELYVNSADEFINKIKMVITYDTYIGTYAPVFFLCTLIKGKAPRPLVE